MLTKQVKDLNDNNFKSLSQEKKKKKISEKEISHAHGRALLTQVKMANLPKVICRFKAIPNKYQHNSAKISKKQFSHSSGKAKTNKQINKTKNSN